MKKVSKNVIIMTAAIMALCLASCGDSEESSSKSGTVSLVTTTTTTAADSSEAETTTTTTAETTTTTEETTTSAETTTTADTTTTAETTTTTAAPKKETMADKLKVTYNGVTFGVGDKFADIESKLGKYNDYFKSAHCNTDGMDDVYIYNGIQVAVFEEGNIHRDI